MVLVEGDTNTVVAAGLAAIKLRVPLGHVEAGIRSYDRTMPEEINRRIVSVCAELHFAPTERAAINLLHEDVPPHTIFITGNTIVDACHQHLEIANRKSRIIDHLGLTADRPFALVTVHRSENVDNKPRLKQIVRILLSLSNCKLIFPVHPRTKKRLERFKLMSKLEVAENVVLSDPLGYLDFLNLLSKSAFVLTDSGGVQEEAITLKTPCLTLRYNTERPETVKVGANRLVGLNLELTAKCVDEILSNSEFNKNAFDAQNPYGDGKAGIRIMQLTKLDCLRGLEVPSSTFLKAGSASYKLLKVNGDMIGKTIKEICRMEKASTAVLMYDQDGSSHFPYSQSVVKEGWSLLLFGEFLSDARAHIALRFRIFACNHYVLDVNRLSLSLIMSSIISYSPKNVRQTAGRSCRNVMFLKNFVSVNPNYHSSIFCLKC